MLRRLAESLRAWPGAAAPAGTARIELLLGAVARNARQAAGEGLPPSAAMLEAMLRELPAPELTAALDRLPAEEREAIAALLARMEPSDAADPARRRAGFSPPPPPEPEPAGEPRVARRRSTAVVLDRATLDRARLESLLLPGDAALERGVLDRVQGGEFDSATSAWLLQSIVDGSRDEENRKRALSLVRPDRFSRARTIRTRRAPRPVTRPSAARRGMTTTRTLDTGSPR